MGLITFFCGGDGDAVSLFQLFKTKVRPIMKDRILPFREIEWWLMTILIFLIILTNTLGAKIDLDRLTHSGGNFTAQYFAYIFIPLAMYGGFYLFHMKSLPAYQNDRQKAKMILYSLLDRNNDVDGMGTGLGRHVITGY